MSSIITHTSPPLNQMILLTHTSQLTRSTLPHLHLPFCLKTNSHILRPMTLLFSHFPQTTKPTLRLTAHGVSSDPMKMFPLNSEAPMAMSATTSNIFPSPRSFYFLLYCFRGCRASGGVLEFESRHPTQSHWTHDVHFIFVLIHTN